MISMVERLGNVLYWFGCIIAGLALLVAGVHGASILGLTPGRMEDAGFAAGGSVVFGASIWICGRVCRYVLAGRF